MGGCVWDRGMNEDGEVAGGREIYCQIFFQKGNIYIKTHNVRE